MNCDRRDQSNQDQVLLAVVPNRPRPIASVLLGAFICFELLYLPVANAMKLVPVRKPPEHGELVDDIQVRGAIRATALQPAVDALGAACDRWGELTGQGQGWSLFGPHFSRHAALPVVHLTWVDPPSHVALASHFEPANLDAAFRAPEARCRLYNYEYRLALAGISWDPQPLSEQMPALERSAAAHARRQHRSILAYLGWRVDQYRRARAEPALSPPDVVELRATLFPNRGLFPSGAAEPCRELRIAVWHPKASPPAGYLPLQFFDPDTCQLTWLRAEESP